MCKLANGREETIESEIIDHPYARENNVDVAS